MLKESENPPVLWPENGEIHEFSGTWWVGHTKSRNEKALANDLAAQNISYFLPMAWKTSHKRGRKIRSLLPLFGGYIFFCGSEEDRLKSLRTNRLANLIEVSDQDKLVRELGQIKQAIDAGVDVSPHQYLKEGQKCRVLSGPLQGLQGKVIKMKGITRLVLQVDMLGQAASVEIDTDLIETVEN